MALQHLTDSTFDAAISAAPLALVDFWATWCGPCKIVGPVVEKLADDYDGRVLVGKVEADSETALSERYGISSIPTLILFKNGAEIERRVGVVPEAALREILDANL